MIEQSTPIDKLLYDLKERAKELNCLYEIQELLNKPGITLDEIFAGIVRAIPPGWQYPDVCRAKIIYGDQVYQSPGFGESPWVQRANIVVRDAMVGQIGVYYTEERPAADEGPFLKEERKLVDTIAEQVGLYILHQQLREVFQEQQKTGKERQAEWWVILNMLKRTDPTLLVRLSRKMINYLYWSGVSEAERLLEQFTPVYRKDQEIPDTNQPFQIQRGSDSLAACDEVFELASQHLSKETILENIQLWIQEDQSGFLIAVLINPSSSLAELTAAIERYHHLTPQGLELSQSRQKSCKIALIRRLLSDHPEFVSVAQKFIEVGDFNEPIRHLIYPVGSHGKLGGKSSGLLLASQIIKKAQQSNEYLHEVKTPKSWYVASDAIFYFMSYNGLEDLFDQKYRDINQARQEYPYIVHIFKNSPLPPEITKGLSLALDDFGDVPLIVRSSSALEDRMGMAFAGKYKSLFIANQGSKEERLSALTDAIAEVYASMFGPDPLEYRAEHNLLDHHEEMGILIQEVVGSRVGHYFLPAFAGVAFSHNEYRWSSRIQVGDGLIRLVMGLGTRAVDRLSDDYPVLVAPGQPNLRVNISPDEILRYSPKKIDAINLQTGFFETVEIQDLLRQYGQEYPLIHLLLSIFQDGMIRQPRVLGLDFATNNLIVTFDGLIARTPFMKQVKAILAALQEQFHHPVDIEFAHDGRDFYLLQCRSQSYREGSTPAKIPGGLADEALLFSANRHISNGTVSDITHIVYVDPQKYSQLAEYQEMLKVGRAVSKLNQLLPRRRFILMGPGRWGSRGDIKLGVNVTYSDIKNTAMLIEIARREKNYVPEPSFGTHFF